MFRLGVVSFLNSRPLIAGLAAQRDVQLRYAVPAALPQWLDTAAVDVALVPVVDVLRSGGAYQAVSDAGIACDGETMTVRIFSQQPPDRIDTLWVDNDSHTSVVLARVLWRELYGRALQIRRFDATSGAAAEYPSILLIGDKVVDPKRGSFAFEVDLGGAWRQHTGLPFVFALWAARPALTPADALAELAERLSAARDRGVSQITEIAANDGARAGWPVALAERYLGRCLRYRLTARYRAGMEHFAALAAAADLVPADAQVAWAAGGELTTEACFP
ncbi:MAG: menaquinone biosynthesis protein [Phycisphaerales bacterium]|nr:menaquinone biosynthesis protein [Phycisphaerales bacterium]